jgi:hypothetical protein
MAIDDASGGSRSWPVLPWGARLAITLVLLALYHFGHRLTLPFVDPQAVAMLGVSASTSVLSLGYTPLLTGFLLVELFSVMTSPGRRLRQGGTAGRATLNRAALGTSLVIAAVQAFSIGRYLEVITPPFGGSMLTTDPGIGFLLITMGTLTAMTAAVFVLANVLSDFGIGNGFALLNLVDIVRIALSRLPLSGLDSPGNSAPSDSPVAAISLLLLLVLGGILLRQLRAAEDGFSPAFPQGYLPAGWAVVALSSFILFPGLKALRSLFPMSPWIFDAAVVLILVPLFSWGAFHLFSSRPRLEANLPEPAEVLDRLADVLRRRLLPATLLLTAGTAIAVGLQGYQPNTLPWSLIGFGELVFFAALAFDLWDQFRFSRSHGALARLVQLDNVHFSYRLAARLDEEGIDALSRGHVVRSLYFFLGPLYKIDVLVPIEDLDEARGVLAELESARELKVF